MCVTVSWNVAFLLLEFPESASSGCVRKGMTHQTLLPEEKDNFQENGAPGKQKRPQRGVTSKIRRRWTIARVFCAGVFVMVMRKGA